MIAIKKVLVATDFSPVAGIALVYGRALARTFGAALHVLHVVRRFNVMTAMGDGLVDASSVARLQLAIEDAGRRELDACVTDDDRRELHAETVLVTSSKPATAITEYAKDAGVDVVVIGATGRGAIDRLVMGSVADRVIRQASCPVLAVRHPEREFVVPDAAPPEALRRSGSFCE